LPREGIPEEGKRNTLFRLWEKFGIEGKEIVFRFPLGKTPEESGPKSPWHRLPILREPVLPEPTVVVTRFSEVVNPPNLREVTLNQ